jgi:hypothetical protein
MPATPTAQACQTLLCSMCCAKLTVSRCPAQWFAEFAFREETQAHLAQSVPSRCGAVRLSAPASNCFMAQVSGGPQGQARREA